MPIATNKAKPNDKYNQCNCFTLDILFKFKINDIKAKNITASINKAINQDNPLGI
jgi:hypothetical protein